MTNQNSSVKNHEQKILFSILSYSQHAIQELEMATRQRAHEMNTITEGLIDCRLRKAHVYQK